jgi:transcriptional regulator with GAF, ATPase, and Fis domain
VLLGPTGDGVETSRIDDPERIAALRRTHLLDSGPERLFDQVTRVAASLVGAPSAFVTLIEPGRQYIKSQFQQDADAQPVPLQATLDFSFCKHVVASGEPFVVTDARKHPLVRDNKAVENGVIAYAGVPFQSSGQTLGALCVVDSQPRDWSEDDLDTLKMLARSIERLISEAEEDSDDFATHGSRNRGTPLLEAIANHLAALDSYRGNISRGHSMSFEEESVARDQVKETAQALAAQFAGSPIDGPTLRTLVAPLRRYLAAEERRRLAAEAFSAGTGVLPDLQAAIAEELEAEDSLRASMRTVGG